VDFFKQHLGSRVDAKHAWMVELTLILPCTSV